MPYTKHNWVNGEVITAEKLNNLEDGVDTGASLFIIHGETTVGQEGMSVTLDKELSEILNAITNDLVPIVLLNMNQEGDFSTSIVLNFVTSINNSDTGEAIFAQNNYNFDGNDIDGINVMVMRVTSNHCKLYSASIQIDTDD